VRHPWILVTVGGTIALLVVVLGLTMPSPQPQMIRDLIGPLDAAAIGPNCDSGVVTGWTGYAPLALRDATNPCEQERTMGETPVVVR
jgi:hypothetical protein